MKNDLKRKLVEKLEGSFLAVVRQGLNDEDACERVRTVKAKYPGLPRDALADVLIKRAITRTGLIGAASGMGITGGEAVMAAPVPEPGHKVAAVSGIAASMIGDLASSTIVQMRLLQEIGHVYDCPFIEDDEEDVWLVFQAALGSKGIEKAGGFTRFIYTETAMKQFRRLLRSGIRKAVQKKVAKVAGPKVAKVLAEKYVMRLVPFLNIGIGFVWNRQVTKQVGRWSKIKARIRSGVFSDLDKIKMRDPEVAALALPIILHVGTSADSLTDNTLTLYGQTAKRLNLSDDEVAAMTEMNEERELEALLEENVSRIQSQELRELLFDVALMTAASSRLEFVEEYHQCLQRMSRCLDVGYQKKDFTGRIKLLKG